MNLSKDQDKALRILLEWTKKPTSKFITLGGYAGTGKTTLMTILRHELHQQDKSLKIAFCAFTGKATRVLAEKLTELDAIYPKDNVSTIHSLIYTAILNEKDEIIGWDKKFDLNYDLIVVDEASMLDSAIWRDLLSYGIPIIAIGDHGQLPPIDGNFNLMQHPNIVLEEIHRQAKDNPIIRISIQARTNGQIDFGIYGDKIKKLSIRENQDELQDLVEKFNDEIMMLCGYNQTRVRLNKYVRSQIGFELDQPEFKDRVICLKNNSKKEIYNGMIGKVTFIENDKDFFFAKIDFDDTTFSGLILAKQFNSLKTIEHRNSVNEYDLFDFGYAITVHKAQGSQSKKVILFEERFKQMDETSWKRWLYTAVTRASEELIIFA
jgi:exodeoxyribonuclease-5